MYWFIIINWQRLIAKRSVGSQKEYSYCISNTVQRLHAWSVYTHALLMAWKEVRFHHSHYASLSTDMISYHSTQAYSASSDWLALLSEITSHQTWQITYINSNRLNRPTTVRSTFSCFTLELIPEVLALCLPVCQMFRNKELQIYMTGRIFRSGKLPKSTKLLKVQK
jgi:hypothetical protein